MMMVSSLTLFLEPNVPARIVSWVTRLNVGANAVSTLPAHLRCACLPCLAGQLNMCLVAPQSNGRWMRALWRPSS